MAGGGGRVEGTGEAMENGSPVVVMLVPERMLSETWGAGARENMCSRETVGAASLRSGGREPVALYGFVLAGGGNL